MRAEEEESINLRLCIYLITLLDTTPGTHNGITHFTELQ